MYYIASKYVGSSQLIDRSPLIFCNITFIIFLVKFIFLHQIKVLHNKTLLQMTETGPFVLNIGTTMKIPWQLGPGQRIAIRDCRILESMPQSTKLGRAWIWGPSVGLQPPVMFILHRVVIETRIQKHFISWVRSSQGSASVWKLNDVYYSEFKRSFCRKQNVHEIYSILILWLKYKKTHAYVFEMSNNCIMFYDNHYMMRLIFLEIKLRIFLVNSNV